MIERYRLTMSGMFGDDDGDWVKYEDVEHRLREDQLKVDQLYDRINKLADALIDIYYFVPINPKYGYQGVDADAMYFIAYKALTEV
jgi:hypothetical protein